MKIPRRFALGRPVPQPAADNEVDALTEQSVTWAYRFFLGREPENSAVIEEKLRYADDLAAFRNSFLFSQEFLKSLPAWLRLPLHGDEPYCKVQCDGSAKELTRLFEHVASSWQELGSSDPYYSVLTQEEFAGLPSQERIEAFFRSGPGDVERFLLALQRNELDLTGRPVCLEYGCGLGRITQALAPRFQKVIGVDISRTHLAEASKQAHERRVDNIEWMHLESIAALDRLPPVDVIYSMIVLQHNPPPVIDRIVSTFARILKPGGIAYFQVPTYRLGYEFDLREYLDSCAGPSGIEMHVYPQHRVFQHFAQVGAIPVSVVEDGATGRWVGERSNTFLFLRK